MKMFIRNLENIIRKMWLICVRVCSGLCGIAGLMCTRLPIMKRMRIYLVLSWCRTSQCTQWSWTRRVWCCPCLPSSTATTPKSPSTHAMSSSNVPPLTDIRRRLCWTPSSVCSLVTVTNPSLQRLFRWALWISTSPGSAFNICVGLDYLKENLLCRCLEYLC